MVAVMGRVLERAANSAEQLSVIRLRYTEESSAGSTGDGREVLCNPCCLEGEGMISGD